MPTIIGGSGNDVLTAPAPGGVGYTLLSATSGGASQASSLAIPLSMSADGTKLLFMSDSSTLTAYGTHGDIALFVKNLQTGAVTMVAVTSGGVVANRSINSGGFSPDGSKVYFCTDANNLTAGDTNSRSDLYVKDLVSGAVSRVLGPNGAQPNGSIAFLNAVGSKVLVASGASNLGPTDVNGATDLYLLDTATGAWTLLSTRMDGSQFGGVQDGLLSPDGTKLAFSSVAGDIVAGDTNGLCDIFIKDLATGVITRVSTNGAGGQANGATGNATAVFSFSSDGSRLLFHSPASNLAPGDTNNSYDVFVKDLTTGAVTLVSANAAGVAGNAGSSWGRFSPDGAKVVFVSAATNLDGASGVGGAFVKDLVTGAITRVGPIGAYVGVGLFSPDGKMVVFPTEAALLAADANTTSDIYGQGAASGAVQNYTIYGGDGNDVITGGGGLDKLYGDAGDDTITGGGAADQLFGGAGVDVLNGGDGADRLDGGSENDTLNGGADNDYLDGGTGADVLRGGPGNDVYIVDDIQDTTVELGNEGADVVRASVDWTLAANTEALELQGKGDVKGTGNELANNMSGNDGNNLLDGGDGGDTLDGGAGNDRLIGGKGNDVMTGGTGMDTFVITHASIGATMLGGSLETDTVRDLNKGQGDRLDLSAIDADISTPGEQAFHLVSVFSRHPAELVLTYTAANNTTLLKLDVDGDGKADYQMKITGDVHLDSGGWVL